jgi:hypothetical protein
VYSEKEFIASRQGYAVDSADRNDVHCPRYIYLGLPVFDPAREKRIFARMRGDNPDPAGHASCSAELDDIGR